MKKEINEIVEKYREIKESSFYPFELIKSDSDAIKVKKETIRKEFEILEKKIQDFKNPKELADIYKNDVLKAVEVLLEYVQKSKLGSPLDRNQGLIIDNFIFGKVVGVIRHSLKHGGVSYSDFYYRPGGDFDETELRKLLIDLRNQLMKQDFESYFQLEKFVEGYFDKVKSLWNKENMKVAEAS